jgi:uncharacterized protein YerC
MPRANSIKKLPEEQRRFIEKLLRSERYTLDEILDQVRTRFPAGSAPSRSALGRYSQQVDELARRMRDIQAASSVLVSELGEDPHDKAGQMLVEAVTTLATRASLDALGQDKEISVKQVGELARGARAVLQARKMSLAERQEIARIAREQAAEEAASEAREGGVSEATIARIRDRVLRGGG